MVAEESLADDRPYGVFDDNNLGSQPEFHNGETVSVEQVED